MFGQINRITAKPGQRDALVEAIRQGSGFMPGCHTYLVGCEMADQDSVWVVEVWDVAHSHTSSLQLPEVRASIEKATPLIATFETMAALDILEK